ncbi:MAG TPA: hypothetical protein VML58_00555 [Burkholderiaceae bacterium]|nr:hypothetical protein [Burkholderiaceae bacterium]
MTGALGARLAHAIGVYRPSVVFANWLSELALYVVGRGITAA